MLCCLLFAGAQMPTSAQETKFTHPSSSITIISLTTDSIFRPLPFPERGEATAVKGVFTVNSPKNIPTKHRVRETFPLRNYVFFDIGSTQIPDRYVLLDKSQVKDFKEDQLEVFTPKRLSGRSSRQMIVYYNVLNILGDRLGKKPAATIKLVGSSESGTADGRLMAESVKKYLVDVFAISPTRIRIEGREKPKLPSGKEGQVTDFKLVSEGNRRVSIESTSPAILMEFQSGPNAPLKPVELNTVIDAPLDSYVSFNVPEAKAKFTSWSVEVSDEKGLIQNLGPYTEEKVSVPGKDILGTRTSGNFKMTMTGKTKSGSMVKQDTTVRMVLWTPSTSEQAMRFSIIYEFMDSVAIKIYENYLTDIVMPKIPENGNVLIHGYTDIIGEELYNKNLSLARAKDVLDILSNALAKAGRNDVQFGVTSFGENEKKSPFENKTPEERFYNRTVIVDIFPENK